MTVIINILQAMVIGIPQGALYGLMGFGIAMIFRTAGTLNFSHGYSAMTSVLVTLTMFNLFENSIANQTVRLLAAVPFGVGFGAILGILIDTVLMRKIKNISPASMLMVTLGLLLVFEGAANLIWSPNFEKFPAFTDAPPIILGADAAAGVVIRSNDIIVMLVALTISISMALIMKYTSIGMSIRARGQDRVGAQVVGVNANFVDRIVWALAISFAVVVGILLAPLTSVHALMLMNTQLFGITAAVLGGFGSLFGAIWGGLIIGVLERLIAFVPAMEKYQTAVIFFLVILVLVFKPEGIFGTRKGRKA
ncbi:MAG: branched-chain amino acid ABC transporter permease [Spirochaetaceae bacterium]|nr:MAG: branched-chain amino acid ABC transporter permease [Spirochaetaceae bacterium]